MTKYLVTYHGDGMPHDPEAMAAARAAFVHWASKTGAPLVDPGSPIVATRTVSTSGVGQGRAEGPVLGWSLLEASSPEAAAELLADHPFIGRGGSLQINEPPPT